MCLMEFIIWFSNLLTDFIMGTIDFFYIPIAESFTRYSEIPTATTTETNTILLLLILLGFLISLSCRD